MLDVTVANSAQAVVLVEGVSDLAALEAVATRRGLPLGQGGLVVLPMGGATNIRRYLHRLGPGGLDVRLAGLCDAGEADFVRLALEQAGFCASPSWADMERCGFYVCFADLEDELIRALGTDEVEQIIESQGELGSFRTFQQQPAQQGVAIDRQLHRFMGTRSGRKSQYAGLIAAALDPASIPRPLDRVLSHW